VGCDFCYDLRGVFFAFSSVRNNRLSMVSGL